MKTGDRVFVEVGRNKERFGEITAISDKTAWVRFSNDTLPQIFDRVKLKSPPPLEAVALKYDSDKPRMSLIPPEAIEEIANAFTFGAKKYSADNWRKGFAWRRLADSSLRHLHAWLGGEDKDPESGLSHLAHLGACVSMLIAHEKSNLGEDDRWKK